MLLIKTIKNKYSAIDCLGTKAVLGNYAHFEDSQWISKPRQKISRNKQYN